MICTGQSYLPHHKCPDGTDHITPIKDVMIRQSVCKVGDTADDTHDRELSTAEWLHVPHAQ